jgi:hypothetical protein
MFSTKTLCQIAAYSISLPTFAARPALAKETVYMPSRVAALVLGTGNGVIAENAGELVNRSTGESVG